MAFGEKIIPLSGVNTDLHESLMRPDLATFIKNLVYEIADTADAAAAKGSQTGVFKPLQSNEIYIDNLVLPPGFCQNCGNFSFRELKQVFVFIYNSEGQHLVYRLNGENQTYNVVYQGPLLNFQLAPEFFIHKGGCWLEQIFIADPATGRERIRTYLMFTEGFNGQRFICVEDSIATSSFNSSLFPYFQGNYDAAGLINMGVLTPSDCIDITEVPLDPIAETQNNRLLFNTWQFRLLYADVWGRPSEHGIISNQYIPAQGDCIANSSGLPRCVNLEFDAPPPYINSVQIEYRNCNSTQWYLSDILELYDGSPLGDWWLRSRNSSVEYNSSTNKITYTFCADKKCDPIATTETRRLYNPLPRTSFSVAAVGNFIALANNEDGFLPFSQTLLDKISFTVIPPSATAMGNAFRNISVLIEIFNFNNTGPNGIGNGQIFLYNNHYYFQRLPTGKTIPVVFSGIEPAYSQFFANPNQQGFIGYLAGTNTFTISEQYSLSAAGIFTKVTDFTKFDTSLKYFQKFTFNNVKKGKYIFRIAGLTVDPAVDTPVVMFKTSTYVIGQFPFNINNPVAPVTHNLANNKFEKELIIDVCDADYDSVNDTKILVIADWTDHPGPIDQGYVVNTDDATQDQYGIELLQVLNGYLNSKWTDHNGYFFAAFTSSSTGGGGHYYIKGYCNCQIVSFANNVSSGQSHQQFTDNYFLNKSTVCTNYNDTSCNYVLIRGKITTCDTNIPVPNISVTLTRGHSAVSDADGFFSIIAHDDVITGSRQDSLIFNSPTCNFTDCNSDCIGTINVQFFPCVVCQPRQVDVETKQLVFKTPKGLLSGGVYPVAFVGWDDRDRPTFAQQKPSYYVQIPSVQTTNVFSPSTVRVDIDVSAIFPPETRYITPWIGAETTIEEYITWIVDSFELIDNTGLINTMAPTQIKIFYASLIEYNKQNNYNTTVNWSFIPEGSTTPVISDKVEFLLNGDGTFFPRSITALIKYDTTGQYFLINYTSDLKDLKANAIIRLVRPKACTGTEPYYEICQKIPIVNQKATITSFILNAYDTYYINRQIPVPTLQPNSSPPTYINEPRSFGVPFESSSPSDFWGQGCHNIGREITKNPYETVVFSPEQIALSGALSPNGQLNYLNYFDDAKKVDFSDTAINGIVALLVQTSTVLVLGQSDSFILGFNDNIARVNSEGQVMAPSIENQFGQPEKKVGSNYGCMYYDKNTIYEKEGIVQFLDTSKAALIQHNYQSAIPISNNGAEGLIRKKVKAVQLFNSVNSNPRRYFTGIINPINHEYLLTDHIIGNTSFVNTLREFDQTVQETLVFDVFGKAFKGSYGFTPEYYAELEGEINDQQLFSFKNGVPYRHYSVTGPVTYNTFYGQLCERIMEVVIVMDNLKKKKPLSLAEYCKQGAYFVDRVTTETGQLSRILLSYFLEAEYGWYAPFLCDLNTPSDPNLPMQTGPNKLLDGNMLTGTWIKLRLIGNPEVNDQYSEFQGIAVEVFPSEKSGTR